MPHCLPRDGKLPATAAPQPRLTLCLAQCGFPLCCLSPPQMATSVKFISTIFWLFEVAVSLLVSQKSFGGRSHNSDWQMLFSSVGCADELPQGWLRPISLFSLSGDPGPRALFPGGKEVCALPRWKFRCCRGA